MVKNVIIDQLEFAPQSEKTLNLAHSLPDFLRTNYAESLKQYPRQELAMRGGKGAHLRANYMNLFSLTPIDEERMSEENLASLNSRKRSKANVSQSNMLSGFASKEHSFTRGRHTHERESWMSKKVISEVDQLEEARSIESCKEASTKIEDMPDSIVGDKRDSVQLDDSRIIKPEINIPAIKINVKHTKAASMAEPASFNKGSPKIVLENKGIHSPTFTNVQMGKAIKNLKTGTSNDWNKVFDKKGNKPSVVHVNNPSNGGNISALKLNTSPSKKSVRDDKKKQPTKLPMAVKTAESLGTVHRRTASDFNQLASKISFQVNTARGSGKAKGKTDCKTEEKTSPTKTIGSVNSDFGSPRKLILGTSDHKKKSESAFKTVNGSSKKEAKQPQVIVEKNLKGLLTENILLKHENSQIRQMLDQNSELVEKYKSLVNVIQQNMDTLKHSVDTEIIMDFLEPFEISTSPNKKPRDKGDGPAKPSTCFSSKLNKEGISDSKKRLSGDFGGPLSKKTGNNLSAKDLRHKISSPSENTASAKDIRASHSLTRKNGKTAPGKDKTTSKKQ